ncbi:hypothetical protein GP2143_10512 [marine gamma proteobacterium HTCC2143]|jgi:hypothetical protein|uniref:Uncharacterized protein n=1 Tax=marine gamma proteobacterium HTCC2143 TaxID=247633 RepID=A0YDY9_9GAMM|nr:hypothetical protein GP2143_10512 [marine gamma proteobacterium HTCC2143]
MARAIAGTAIAWVALGTNKSMNPFFELFGYEGSIALGTSAIRLWLPCAGIALVMFSHKQKKA